MRTPERTFSRARELRRKMSVPEIVLWQALRKRALTGLRFRRQHPIGPYILDFYCPGARLAVEVDGFAHDTAVQARHDERRGAWLAAQGIRILRIRPSDVLNDERLEGVLHVIEHAATPPDQVRGRHLPRKRGRNRRLAGSAGETPAVQIEQKWMKARGPD